MFFFNQPRGQKLFTFSLKKHVMVYVDPIQMLTLEILKWHSDVNHHDPFQKFNTVLFFASQSNSGNQQLQSGSPSWPESDKRSSTSAYCGWPENGKDY